MPAPRQLSLNAFIYPTGHHEASWRHPDSRPDRITDIAYFQELAQTAEAAKLDAVFFADGPALRSDARFKPDYHLEPVTTLTAMAAATSRVGLIATASTTYYEPYNLARLFSSLDHLSRGRAGWNIVTTSTDAAAANFGLDEHPPAADRYARATEFVEATIGLWDSWEDDALVVDKSSGTYADAARIHRVDARGEHLRVRGPLNSPRSPQGRPVLIQAGSSNDGREFAGRYAEAIFTAHQRLGDAQAFYSDIKARALRVGRNPDHVKVLPGLSPFIADSPAEARDAERELNELTIPAFGLEQVRKMTGIDLSGVGYDDEVPQSWFEGFGDLGDTTQSRRSVVAAIVLREKPTVRQLLYRLAGARGHNVVAGTPHQIVTVIETWFRTGAADGFNIMPPVYPTGLDAFTERVVPILQDKGLFRSEYTGTTLREHYGLPRPESRYAAEPLAGSTAS